MGNLGETKTVDKIVVEIGGNEYVLAGGGSGQPAADSVGSKEIKNEAVMMEDLNSEVKEAMMTKNDRVTQEELDNFEV